MTANIDPETGIAYGTIYLNSLADWVFDEFFYHGTNLTSAAAEEDFLAEWRADNPDAEEGDEDDALQDFWDDYYCNDEELYRLETDGMILEISYLGGAAMVWVLKSPHTRMVRECSPCCPNAGDLDSGEGGVVAYDLPPEWYGKEEACCGDKDSEDGTCSCYSMQG